MQLQGSVARLLDLWPLRSLNLLFCRLDIVVVGSSCKILRLAVSSSKLLWKRVSDKELPEIAKIEYSSLVSEDSTWKEVVCGIRRRSANFTKKPKAPRRLAVPAMYGISQLQLFGEGKAFVHASYYSAAILVDISPSQDRIASIISKWESKTGWVDWAFLVDDETRVSSISSYGTSPSSVVVLESVASR